MAIASSDNAMRSERFTRTLIHLLLPFALFCLLPPFVMVVNSFKPLSEITAVKECNAHFASGDHGGAAHAFGFCGGLMAGSVKG